MLSSLRNCIAIGYASLKLGELTGLEVPLFAIFESAMPLNGKGHVSLVDAFVIMHLLCMAEHWAEGYDAKKRS